MLLKTVKQICLTGLLIFISIVSYTWAEIIVFMDNSGSIRDYKSNFHQQIREVYGMAEDVNKSVTFIPIGEDNFQKAENFEQAKRIFTFDSSFTYVAEAFKQAERNGYIHPEDTVIIISDMEPDMTNTDNNWQLLACDYQNMLDWYNLLNEWMSKKIYIHILLLNAVSITQFNPEELLKTNIIKELKQNINGSTELEKLQARIARVQNKTIKRGDDDYYKNKEDNQRFVARVVKSLQTATIDPSTTVAQKSYISLYPMSIKENIMVILESIIDPTIIKNFRVKIEIDPNVINLSRPDQRYIQSYLENNAPENICTNPVRKAIYFIVNGPGSNEHDNSFQYHYKILSGQFTSFIDIMLSNQFTKEQGTIGVMSDHPDRQQYNIKYADINDLIYKILNALNHLQHYQARDFPLGEKKILITLETEYLKYLQAERLTAQTKNVSKMMMTQEMEKTKLSSRIKKISKNKGQCSLWVKRQADSEIYLSLESYRDPQNPDEILIPLGTVKSGMLHGSKNNIVFKDQKDIPVLVSDIKIVSDEQAFKSKIQVLKYDFTEYNIVDKFVIESKEQIRKLLPGSYRFNVIHDALYSSCLNNWLTAFHIPFCLPNINTVECERPPVISAYCSEDQFKDYEKVGPLFAELIKAVGVSMDPDAPPPKLGPNELNGTFKDHLAGSPYFFLRLFEYTSNHFKSDQIIIMKEIWRRIYFRLFFDDTAFRDNMLPEMLAPALNKLRFYENNQLIPKSHIYLKIMLAKFSNQDHNVYLTTEEKRAYQYLLRILYEKLKLNIDMLKQLSLRK